MCTYEYLFFKTESTSSWWMNLGGDPTFLVRPGDKYSICLERERAINTIQDNIQIHYPIDVLSNLHVVGLLIQIKEVFEHIGGYIYCTRATTDKHTSPVLYLYSFNWSQSTIYISHVGCALKLICQHQNLNSGVPATYIHVSCEQTKIAIRPAVST